ncbi:MAG: urease accessory protein UreE, partial [Ramlibacter sp.]|nr:urease accessory protein UreE [Ramlibacter sp.]
MLRAMHLIVRPEDSAFEPEGGAYSAGGHAHAHAHAHVHSHPHPPAVGPLAHGAYGDDGDDHAH